MLPSNPQLRQKVLLGVLLIGGLGYLGFEYLYTPRATEVRELESRLETLQLQNRTARALTQGEGISDIERRLAMYREQLVAVEGLIPLSEELPDLLDAISAEAQRSGVELSRLQPTAANEEEFYTRRSYSLAVVGTYHNIGHFLTRIGSLPRIITPTNLNLTPRSEQTPEGEPRLEATFSIETYVLPLEAPAADATNAT